MIEIAKFMMMCGIPGSGKSTVAYSLADEHDATVYSSDSLRKEMFGDENDNSNNEEMFKELHKRIKNDLERGKNAIYDATNISYKRRMAFLEEIKKYNCEKVCYLVATPYDVCVYQNESRGRVVPVGVIDKMYKNFYIPQKYEGWDDIQISWSECIPDKYTEKPFESLAEFNQENPNHSLTLGNHLLECAKNVGDGHLWVKTAAIYHDIGKPFVKSFINSKGEPSDIAHYYNHHLVSAYEAMFYLKKQGMPDKFILRVCNLIQWHMQLYFAKTEKARHKLIRLVGEDTYSDLMILHKADKDAH